MQISYPSQFRFESESLVVSKILNNMKEGEGRPKMMKKGRLIEELESVNRSQTQQAKGAT